jgi:hypothetical protein
VILVRTDLPDQPSIPRFIPTSSASPGHHHRQ